MIPRVLNRVQRPVRHPFGVEEPSTAPAHDVCHAITCAAIVVVRMTADHDIYTLLLEERNPIRTHKRLARIAAAVPEIRVGWPMEADDSKRGILSFRPRQFGLQPGELLRRSTSRRFTVQENEAAVPIIEGKP